MDKKRASISEEASADVDGGTAGTYAFNYKELPSLRTLNEPSNEVSQPPSKNNKMSGVENRAFAREEPKSAGEYVRAVPSAPDASPPFSASEAPPPYAAQTSTEQIKSIKLGIMKNIVVISIAFVFLFTAYNSLANLQSSINKELGTISLATLYAALVVSCAFIPPFLISRLKLKFTIAFCMLGYSAYMAAQFYPTYYTMIPGAILLGLGAAPMWSAKCTYLTEVGGVYAQLTNQNKEVIVTRMFGVFFLFFQSSQVWGNLISSAVLSVDSVEIDPSDPILETCGINYCPDASGNDSANATDNGVSQQKLYTLSTIYLVCALLSTVIVLVLVDPLSRFCDYETKPDATASKSGGQLLMATFRHLTHPYQILIIPLTIWSGVEQAFIQGDFTNAFISCGLGVQWIGYVMICYGVCDALCSVCFSPLVKLVGRIPIFLLGCVANVIIIVLFFMWRPNPTDIYIYFIAAGVWGVADAVWQTQINAFYGVIFPGKAEAAFSNYRMWESVGFILTFVTNSMICIDAKLYIVIGFLFLGMVGYLTIEVLERFNVLPRGADGQLLKLID